MSNLWDNFVVFMMNIGLPLVTFHFAITNNVFLNTATEDAQGLEKIANYTLVPFQYLFVGEIAKPIEQDDDLYYCFEPRFDYQKDFWVKTAASTVALIPSCVVGSILKSISFLSCSSYDHYQKIISTKNSKKIVPNTDLYKKLGLAIKENNQLEPFFHSNYKRNKDAENHLAIEKKALKEITTIFNQNNIPFWVDCGTCLGTYRYGGIIPWDYDIDIAVLQLDFDNIKRALNHLDPEKYTVQDWSTRDFPKSYIKVFIKENQRLIDIYHFAIDTKNKTLNYVFSLENHLFFPEWWKTRERRFKTPVTYDLVFPLKKASFDGVEVCVPNKTKEYLQTQYGENISPAKIYNEQTCSYDKDPTHPYWKILYAQ